MMVVLGLGSNIGDRAGYLRQALQALSSSVTAKRYSSLYETAALLPENAPPEWDIAFYNMVVCGETSLSPYDLLNEVKRIEQLLGRQDRGRWGPREIDIDILIYEDVVMETPELTIPYEGLTQRDFQLVPLAELMREWIPPAAVGQRPVRELAASIPKTLQKLELSID